MMKSIHVFSFIFLFNICFASDKDTTKKSGEHFELSFGQSVFFISQSQQYNIRKNEGIVVPTSAILFFSELRPKKRLAFQFFLISLLKPNNL